MTPASKLKRAFWGAALFAAIPLTAHAQTANDAPAAPADQVPPGLEGVAADTGQDPICDLNTGWRVIGIETPDMPGMILQMNRRDASGKPDCLTKDVAPDFTIGKPEEALWLTGLAADHLILSRSTGPKIDLVVFRLTDQAKVLDVPAYEPDFDSWGITFWQQKEVATAENCVDYGYFTADGLNGVIAHESRYDFASSTVLTSGQTRCEATQ
ncbi:MAG: hypothetical protein MUC58_05620 [Rhizobiaceae bacterium]|jgi:hypothetical protein|nr:hypothetical protein [Rhizobiaceae bacterium]